MIFKMIFTVVISLYITSGLAAPVEYELEGNNKHRQSDDGSIPVAVLLVVPEQPVLREYDEDLMQLSPESARPLPISNERAAKNYYEGSYPPAAYKPESSLASANSGAFVATFPTAVSPSAVPLLLSCAPKVVTGKLAELKTPEYRSVFSDLAEILSSTSSDDNDFNSLPSSSDLNLSDILGLDSPTSVISLEGNDDARK